MSAQPRMATWLEQAWLVRYLERELDEAETVWFEEYMLDKPELAAQIDQDTDLRDAVHLSARMPEQLASNDMPAVPTGSAAAPIARRRWPAPLALAACLVAGVGVGALTARTDVATRGDIVGDPTRVLYDTARGEALTPHVDHAGSDSPHVLIDIAVPPGATDVVLHFDGVPDLPLRPSSDGIVTALVPRAIIERTTAGRLTFSASGRLHERELPTSPLHRRTEP